MKSSLRKAVLLTVFLKENFRAKLTHLTFPMRISSIELCGINLSESLIRILPSKMIKWFWMMPCFCHTLGSISTHICISPWVKATCVVIYWSKKSTALTASRFWELMTTSSRLLIAFQIKTNSKWNQNGNTQKVRKLNNLTFLIWFDWVYLKISYVVW